MRQVTESTFSTLERSRYQSVLPVDVECWFLSRQEINVDFDENCSCSCSCRAIVKRRKSEIVLVSFDCLKIPPHATRVSSKFFYADTFCSSQSYARLNLVLNFLYVA